MQTRQAVRLVVEQELDRLPERAYPTPLYRKKCDAVYEHIYDAYWGEGKCVYATQA